MPIVAKRLTHTYMPDSPFEFAAITDVSLTIEEGRFYAIVGHTGSGKSTLVQHFNGLLKPTSGTIMVDGNDLWAEKADRRTIRREVGLVFQYPEYQLFEESVEKDIAFGPLNMGLSSDETALRTQEACERVGLDFAEVAQRSPFELSGGQRRRVAIAGVLAMRPKYLVLDEPAAGLDPRGREGIFALISGLKHSGVTIVMVSHSMDDVARFAEHMIVMRDGSVVMNGPPADIFQHDEELVEMRLGVPVATRISRMLQRKGVDVKTSISLDELARDVAARASRYAP